MRTICCVSSNLELLRLSESSLKGKEQQDVTSQHLRLIIFVVKLRFSGEVTQFWQVTCRSDAYEAKWHPQKMILSQKVKYQELRCFPRKSENW